MKRALIILGTLLLSSGISMRIDAAKAPTQRQPLVSRALKNDSSPALRDIQPLPLSPGPAIREIPLQRLRPRVRLGAQATEGEFNDPVVQDWHGEPSLPAPVQSFEGLSNANNQQVVGGQVVPPDTNGDVGPNHYVQWVNLVFAIYNKAGALLAGPFAGNALWSGFGEPCETSNDGDPIVLYDHLADRWLLSQFAFPSFPNGPFFQCLAISQTGDPTGAYHRYAFQMPVDKLNDYPKFGVWPDAYYMSVNQFAAGSLTASGAGAAAFERDKMLQGLAAQLIYFDLESVDPSFAGLLPADLDGSVPSSGTPNPFLAVTETPTDQLNVWEFRVNFSNPSSSTFGVGGQPNFMLITEPFSTNFGIICALFYWCVPQPNTNRKVDVLADRLMFRLQYRNFESYQTLVTNHTVNVGSRFAPKAGIRWYELRNSGSGWSIFQQGTYAPDADNRWMGSIAMDVFGNIALGFSVSSSATFPSIRYVGRVPGDIAGTLPQGETELIAGSGSQTAFPYNRWGDYSMLAVDPTDNCTFWYTQEYYATTSSLGWQTRIGSFKFPSCGAP